MATFKTDEFQFPENDKPACRCCQCKFMAGPDKFEPSFSSYHDLRCPHCGTTDIDTVELNKAWAARGARYGYGDHNLLSTDNP